MPFVLWIQSLFMAIASFFGEFMTKKIAMVAAAVTALTAIMATFKVAIDAALNAITAITPTGAFLFGLGLLPSNTTACITAILTAQTASIIYIYWRNIIAFRLTSN
jgi:hypothetical protein